MVQMKLIQNRAMMEAGIQKDAGKTLRRFTIPALFRLSIFTEPLHTFESPPHLNSFAT